MKRIMRTVMLALILGLLTVSAAFAEDMAAPSNFTTYTDANGTVYDHFVVIRLNCGEDRQVQSVTGYYERTIQGEDCEEPEAAPNSDQTYPLAQDFTASMIADVYDVDAGYVTVTDLYQWYIDAYLNRENYDGHALVFSCDLTDEEMETFSPDFWAVTTCIRLNAQGEVLFMRYVHVPWE